MSVTEQKMLIMIMERAKRPILLKAAGIFKLNLSTLMAVSFFIIFITSKIYTIIEEIELSETTFIFQHI